MIRELPVIRLGYAAINTELKAKNIMVNRTARLATITSGGLEVAKSLAKENLAGLHAILHWNEVHGIRFYRMSSDMFPHFSSERVDYGLDFASESLEAAGRYAREHGHRLTFHPGQFVNLGSPSASVVAGSLRELAAHAEIFRYMGLTPADGACMIIHGGGTYGDKAGAIGRIRAVVRDMPAEVRQYVVFENDEIGYSPADLLPICEEFGLGFCLDVFHYKVMYPTGYSAMLTDDALWARIAGTWNQHGPQNRMKIHVSSQRADGRRGAHADFIDPAEIDFPGILRQCKKIKGGVDIMIEAKAKEQAVLELRRAFNVAYGGYHRF